MADKMVRISFRVSRELYEKIKRRAQQLNKTMSQYIRDLIEADWKKDEAEESRSLKKR